MRFPSRRSTWLLVILTLDLVVLCTGTASAQEWGPPIPLENAAGAHIMDFAPAPDGTLVAVFSDPAAQPNAPVILGQRLARDLTPIGSPVQLVDGAVENWIFLGMPRIVIDADGSWHLVFMANNRGGSGNYDAWYRAFTSEGTPQSDWVALRRTAFTSRYSFDLVIEEVEGERFLDLAFGHIGTGLEYHRLRLSDQRLVSRRRVSEAPLFYHEMPRIFPLGDGTRLLFLVTRPQSSELRQTPIWVLRLDDRGVSVADPVRISPDLDEYVWNMAAARNEHGGFYVVASSRRDDLPSGRVVRCYLVDEHGTALRAPWVIESAGVPYTRYGSPNVVVSADGNPDVFLTERPVRSEPYRDQKRRIVRLRYDEATASIRELEVIAQADSLSYPYFRSVGRFEAVGTYQADDDGASGPFRNELVRSRPSRTCRKGTLAHPALLVAGQAGDRDHVVRVAAETAVPLAIAGDGDAAGVRFYVQARVGAPQDGQSREITDVGLFCHDVLDHAAAGAVWNALGGLRRRLGSSRVVRVPVSDPPAVPGVFVTLPPALTRLNPGTRVTFQGVRSDTTSRRGFAVTNAVILLIE